MSCQVRTRALATCALATVVSLLTAGAAVADTRLAATTVPCRSTDAVLRTDRAILFEQRRPLERPPRNQQKSLWGCERGARRARLVHSGELWSRPRLAGRFAAVEAVPGESRGCYDLVVRILDLRSGRSREVSSGQFRRDSSANGCSGFGAPVSALVVRDDGAAAFIAEAPGQRQVLTVAGGQCSIVAAAADVGRTSLRLTPRAISWIQGVTSHEASLPPTAPPRTNERLSCEGAWFVVGQESRIGAGL